MLDKDVPFGHSRSTYEIIDDPILVRQDMCTEPENNADECTEHEHRAIDRLPRSVATSDMQFRNSKCKVPLDKGTVVVRRLIFNVKGLTTVDRFSLRQLLDKR